MKWRLTSALILALSTTGCPDDKPTPTADSGVPGPNPRLVIDPNPSTLELIEGGPSATFTVRLSADPKGAVSIALTSSDPAALAISPVDASLDSSNFSTGVVVTLAPQDDEDAENESVEIQIESDVGTQRYTLNVADDDAPNLVVLPSEVTMVEGGIATIEVRLSAVPQEAVMIGVSSTDAARLMIAPASLTFDAENWQTPQAVTLTALDDVDLADNLVEVTFDHPSLSDVTVIVTIQDDDAQSYVVSTSSITIPEAGSSTFAVSLAAQPAGDVTVTIASTMPSVAIADPPELVFTPANWDVMQVVRVSGVDDVNIDTDTATISVSSPDVPGAANVRVTVLDDDTQIILVDTSSVTVYENNDAPLGVRLGIQPAGDVTVSIAISDPAVIGVNALSLTFTPANYDDYQYIAVSGTDDADALTSTAAITLSAASAATITVPVRVLDDDANMIVTDLASVTVAEGASQTLGLRLTAEPSADVVVTGASAGGAFSVNPATITFTPANWDTLQFVSIDGVQDQDVADESDTLQLSALGFTTVSVPVTVTDDDIQEIVVSSNAITVAENGATTFDVTLLYEPAGDVTVDLTAADAFIGVNPSSVTFTPQNWNVPRAITVSGLDDVNTVDETSMVTLSTPGVADVVVSVTVADDDTQQIVLDRNALSVVEGASGTFSVSLAFQPPAPRTLTIASSDPGAATAAPQTVTFDATNWNVPQPVTVTGVQDNDVANESAVITVSGDGLADATVAVTVLEDDTQAILLSRNTLALNEGASDTVNVTLQYQPIGNVTVMVASNNAAVGAAPAMLSFDATNYDVPQPVTITGIQDQDLEDETAAVTFSSAGLANAVVTVTVNDDDTQALLVTPTSLSVNEGASGNITVRLAYQPAGNVTVTITSQDANAATASPAMLTFDASNYATPQNVTIGGAQDADVQDESVNVIVASAGLTSVTVAVTVVDDDVLNLNVNPASLALTEGGAAGTFTVSLTQQPSQPVTVNLAAAPANEIGLSATTLSFDGTTWNMPQSVSVAALQDDDALDESVTITVSANGLTPRTISVSVADDDTQAIVLSTNAISLDEGTNGTVTVRLAYDPVTPATVTITSGDAGAVGRSPATLTFTSANYATPQPVTISALADDDTRNENVNVTFASPIADVQTLAVTVTDDDVQSIVLTRTTVTLNEGTTMTVGVSLAFDPVTPVTVTAASSDAGAASANPATFTFNSANYATPQTLTISGVQDDDTIDESVTITLESMVAPDRTIAVSVNDDDTQAIVISRTTIPLGEGTSDTFTARLAFDPITPVVVTIASSNAAVASVTPATMTFNTNNWSVPQTATVMAPQDDDTRNDNATLTLSSPVTADRTIAVNVTDDDTQAIIVSANNLVVAEDASAAFTVRLAFNPLANVTLTIANSDAGALGVAPTTLSFDASNYAMPQNVTVNGIDDDDALDENVTLTLSGGGAPQPAQVAVTVNDDDVQALILSANAISVTEGGTNTELTVRLAFNPVNPAVVTVASSDPGAATGAPATITFTSANYATPRTIAISGVQDLDVADENVTINVTTPIAPAMQVSVSVTDDDTQAIVVIGSPLTVTEGQTNAFQVRLAFQPAADTTVFFASEDPTVAVVNPASLTFSPSNWDTPRPVDVLGVSDVDQLDESTTVIASSPFLFNVPVQVNVVDDDDQAIIVTPSALSIDEEQNGTFTVRLAFIPLNAIEIVTISSSDVGAATVLPPILAFDANNYATPVTVTVHAETDEDILDENVTITLDSDVAGTPNETVAVSVNDIDVQEIEISEASLVLDEGGAAQTVTVRLTQDPSGDQAVTIASSDPGAVSATPATLVFNSSNYTTPQTVTIAAVDDDDVRDETAEVTYSSPNVTTRVTNVTVNDDDTQAIIATPLQLSVTEGASNTFSVRLAFRPTNPVTVTLTNSDPTVASINPTSLTFDSTNFSTPQTVTVSGTQDANLEDETADITLSDGAGPAPEGAPDVVVDLTVVEDDQQVIIVESIPSTLATSVQEGGPGVPISVRLGFAPRLADGGSDTVEISAGQSGLVFNPSTITFGQTNYDDPVRVMITATDDDDDVTEQVDVELAIVGEVSTTHPVQIVDDEDTVIAATTYTGLTGGTLFTKRQNILWGSTRLAVVGFDTNTGATRIGSNTRELDDLVLGPEIATGGGGTLSAESIEFDGTDFRWFVSSSSGIELARSDETAATTISTQNVAGTSALNFWTAFDGTNAFGLVYREDGGAVSDRLRFRTVRLDGTLSNPTTITISDGSDDVQPNAVFTGTGYTVIYSSASEVRCVRMNASGVLVPSSDVVLSGFPVGGAFVSTVWDGSSLVAAYYNATNSINVVRIDPSTCSIVGQHLPVGGSNVFLSSPPSIAWNGVEYAVAYDYIDNNVEQVGVLLLDSTLTPTSDYEVGNGSRPSITWAGDRWALRYGDPVQVVVGSFQSSP